MAKKLVYRFPGFYHTPKQYACVYLKEDLLRVVNNIYIIIESRRTALDVQADVVQGLLRTAMDKLLIQYNPYVCKCFKYIPSEVESDWESFKNGGEASISDGSLRGLVARTRKLASTIASLQASDFKKSATLSPRSINTKANDAEINSLRNQISELKKQGVEADVDKQNLQSRISKMESTISTLEEENAAKKADQELEEEWNDRIDAAFSVLNQSTSKLDDEAKRATFDRQFYFWSMLVIVGVIAWWLCYFISFVKSAESCIDSFLKIAPWYSPMIFLGALLWASIVQRNKATRHLLMINQEVFKVKYIEGLLKSINKLSSSSDASMDRISSLLDTLIKSYISKSDPEIAKFDQVKEKDTVIDADDFVKIIDAVSKAIKK